MPAFVGCQGGYVAELGVSIRRSTVVSQRDLALYLRPDFLWAVDHWRLEVF